MNTLLLLIVCLTEFRIAAGMRNDCGRFTKSTLVSGKMCSAQDVEFTKNDVSHVIVCAGFCSLLEDCASIFYVESTLECYGCRRMEHSLVTLTGSFNYEREITGHRYMGCYEDCHGIHDQCETPNGRVMESMLKNDLMTVQMCFNHCLSLNMPYFGLQYIKECWCGNESFSRDGVVDRCDTPCMGNNSEICGGWLAISVYKYTFGH